MPPKKLLAEIRKKSNKTFLVCAHINLEGDALGSELAVYWLLKALGKKVILLNEDNVPREYAFLPGAEFIRHRAEALDYDIAILVDCSDTSRIGNIQKLLRKDRLIINIDHHISNSRFGDVNWIEAGSSSACEMIFYLFKALGVKIKKREAICLYAGIMTDTGSFKYKTTSWRTHYIASELLKTGLDVYRIYRYINESLKVGTVEALGKIIRTLSVSDDGRVAWLVVNNSLIRNEPDLAEATDSIIYFARSIAGVEVAMLFKEIRANKETRVNFRSTGKADVNRIAKVFGGGGHRMASGATIRGNFKESVEKAVMVARKEVAG